MYCGHSCLCVCLSLATFLHYCVDPDVTLGNGKCAPNCALWGGFTVSAEVSLLWQHTRLMQNIRVLCSLCGWLSTVRNWRKKVKWTTYWPQSVLLNELFIIIWKWQCIFETVYSKTLSRYCCYLVCLKSCLALSFILNVGLIKCYTSCSKEERHHTVNYFSQFLMEYRFSSKYAVQP